MKRLSGRYLAVICLSGLAVGILGNCGSSNKITNTPPVTQPQCTQSVVFQGGAPIPAHVLDFESFTTTSSGRLDVTLDWTLASSKVGVGIVQPTCTFDQFKANACNFLLQLTSPPKPLKGSVPNASAGTYGLLILNGADVPESLSVQVVLSSSTCPAASHEPGKTSLGELVGAINRPVVNGLR